MTEHPLRWTRNRRLVYAPAGRIRPLPPVTDPQEGRTPNPGGPTVLPPILAVDAGENQRGTLVDAHDFPELPSEARRSLGDLRRTPTELAAIRNEPVRWRMRASMARASTRATGNRSWSGRAAPTGQTPTSRNPLRRRKPHHRLRSRALPPDRTSAGASRLARYRFRALVNLRASPVIGSANAIDLARSWRGFV